VIALSSASALADEVLFRSHILGSNPDLVIGGVTSGRAPWKVTEGSASLDDEGSLRVKVEGLVRVALGTPGPVTQVSASLVCGGTGRAVVATTGAVSLSAEGDAKIEAKINLPSSCFGPVLLVRIAGSERNAAPSARRMDRRFRPRAHRLTRMRATETTTNTGVRLLDAIA
jgi:hypothetical protein